MITVKRQKTPKKTHVKNAILHAVKKVIMIDIF